MAQNPRRAAAPSAPGPGAGAGFAERIAALGAVRVPGADLLVDFWISPGEVAVIYGAGGAGKSRLLDVLRLACPPEAGSLRLFGAPLEDIQGAARAEARRRIGFLGQTPRFLEHLSAPQNVAVPLNLAGRLARDYSRNVDELLAYVGLSSADERPIAELNESVRRRVAVARAIVTGPDLILADEPLGALAPDQAQRLLKILLSMRQAGAALVIATQNPNLADLIGAPEWRIEQGRLFAPDVTR